MKGWEITSHERGIKEASPPSSYQHFPFFSGKVQQNFQTSTHTWEWEDKGMRCPKKKTYFRVSKDKTPSSRLFSWTERRGREVGVTCMLWGEGTMNPQLCHQGLLLCCYGQASPSHLSFVSRRRCCQSIQTASSPTLPPICKGGRENVVRRSNYTVQQQQRQKNGTWSFSGRKAPLFPSPFLLLEKRLFWKKWRWRESGQKSSAWGWKKKRLDLLQV